MEPPTDYATCPGLAPGEVWIGPEIDGSTPEGLHWPLMVVELRFDSAPVDTQVLAMYVLSSMDGVDFADPTQNANQVWPYSPPSAGITVVDNLEIPPLKFKLALGYPANPDMDPSFGPILIRTAFLAKEFVPQGV